MSDSSDLKMRGDFSLGKSDDEERGLTGSEQQEKPARSDKVSGGRESLNCHEIGKVHTGTSSHKCLSVCFEPMIACSDLVMLSDGHLLLAAKETPEVREYDSLGMELDRHELGHVVDNGAAYNSWLIHSMAAFSDDRVLACRPWNIALLRPLDEIGSSGQRRPFGRKWWEERSIRTKIKPTRISIRPGDDYFAIADGNEVAILSSSAWKTTRRWTSAASIEAIAFTESMIMTSSLPVVGDEASGDIYGYSLDGQIVWQSRPSCLLLGLSNGPGEQVFCVLYRRFVMIADECSNVKQVLSAPAVGDAETAYKWRMTACRKCGVMAALSPEGLRACLLKVPMQG